MRRESRNDLLMDSMETARLFHAIRKQHYLKLQQFNTNLISQL